MVSFARLTKKMSVYCTTWTSMIAFINANIRPFKNQTGAAEKNHSHTQNRRHYTDYVLPSPQNFLFHHKIYVIKMSTETRKSWVLATHVQPPPPTPPKKFENFYPASWYITAFSSIKALWPSLRLSSGFQTHAGRLGTWLETKNRLISYSRHEDTGFCGPPSRTEGYLF